MQAISKRLESLQKQTWATPDVLVAQMQKATGADVLDNEQPQLTNTNMMVSSSFNRAFSASSMTSSNASMASTPPLRQSASNWKNDANENSTAQNQAVLQRLLSLPTQSLEDTSSTDVPPTPLSIPVSLQSAVFSTSPSRDDLLHKSTASVSTYVQFPTALSTASLQQHNPISFSGMIGRNAVSAATPATLRATPNPRTATAPEPIGSTETVHS